MSLNKGWQCLPIAFAKVLGCNVQDIYDYLGHDGSEIIWPTLPEPKCRRAFHIQEMYRYALHVGRGFMPFESILESMPREGDHPYRQTFDLKLLLRQYSGVIVTMDHALPWRPQNQDIRISDVRSVHILIS